MRRAVDHDRGPGRQCDTVPGEGIGDLGVRTALRVAGEPYQAVTVTFEELAAEGAGVPFLCVPRRASLS